MSNKFKLIKATHGSIGEVTYSNLKGLFCIYKPPDMDLLEVQRKLKYMLVKGMNQLPCRPVESIVKIDENTKEAYLEKNLADTVQGD
jgi:hypothetical protein